MENSAKPLRLPPKAIAAIERILSKEGRRAEITHTDKGFRVVELAHKTAYREGK